MASMLLAPGDLLNQADDATPELGILDLHERFGHARPSEVARSRSHSSVAALRLRHCAHRLARRTFEKERDWNLQDARDFMEPTGADAVGSFLVFCTCWKVSPMSLPSSVWLISASCGAFGLDCQHACRGVGDFLGMTDRLQRA